jgi:hypothetical protein
MVALLGGRCVDCGTVDCLTFDCIVPTGDRHHKLNQSQRISYYMGQLRSGNLALRCSACNSKKGAKVLPRYLPVTLLPS